MSKLCKYKKLFKRVGISTLAILFLMAGCGEDTPSKKSKRKVSVKKEVAASSTGETKKTDQAEMEAQEELVYRYDQGKRRDPFRSVLELQSSKRRIADLPPLQRVEISDMKLTGIIWGTLGYSALIRTPDGKGYTVRAGTGLGPHKGVVKKITKHELLVQEEIQDIFGDNKNRDVVMILHPQEGKE